jgi:HPt (histidine-containing phosphotransfer) domain-containing protein
MCEEKLYDLEFLNKISGGDPEFIREMISTFKEVAPEYLLKARKLFDKQAIEALSKETHRIIPGVSFLGAKQLEADLMLIEEYTKKNINLETVPALIDSVDDKIERLIQMFDRDFNIV